MNVTALSTKGIVKDAVKGGAFGIGIGLIFQVILAEKTCKLFEWLRIAAFGMGVGFTLTFTIEYLTKLVLKFSPGLGSCLPFHVLLDYPIGFGVFYGIAYIFQPFGLVRAELVPYSLAVGIFTALIGLFFVYSWEIEERLRLEEENKKLLVLEERNRIARELHDSIAQSLYGVNLHLNTIDYLDEHQPQDLPKVFTQLKQILAEIQAEMRLMIYELKPTVFMEEVFSKAEPNLYDSVASTEEHQ
jgi:signal transduction histidine kinase